MSLDTSQVRFHKAKEGFTVGKLYDYTRVKKSLQIVNDRGQVITFEKPDGFRYVVRLLGEDQGHTQSQSESQSIENQGDAWAQLSLPLQSSLTQ